MTPLNTRHKFHIILMCPISLPLSALMKHNKLGAVLNITTSTLKHCQIQNHLTAPRQRTKETQKRLQRQFLPFNAKPLFFFFNLIVK